MSVIIVRPMETLVVERRDGVVTVTMNRPQKKNAVTGTMTAELTSVFREVALSREDRVLVLTGAGGDFSEVRSAAGAAAAGLVNRVVPAAELDKAVDDWASRLAAGPPLALSMIKAQLHVGAESSLAQALEYEATCQTVNFNSADTAEAMAAFVQKRDPKFTGH